MQHLIKTWKLVIKLDITALNDKSWQINKYIQQTNEICEQLNSEDHTRRTCDNLKEIVNNKSKLSTINHFDKYKTWMDKRRGFVDGIGSIAKTLFGTMDANDRNLINEQLNLLQTNQQTIQHAAKSQIIKSEIVQ